MRRIDQWLPFAIILIGSGAAAPLSAGEDSGKATQLTFRDDLPPYLADRGEGIPLSMFGTYLTKGQRLLYLFNEGYFDHNFEYKPEELGFGLNKDFRGKFRANENLVFFGQALTDRLAYEV